MRVLVDPLIVCVIVDAEEIEVLRAPAKFRTNSAADHIPRLKLRLPVTFGGVSFFRVRRAQVEEAVGARIFKVGETGR